MIGAEDIVTALSASTAFWIACILWLSGQRVWHLARRDAQTADDRVYLAGLVGICLVLFSNFHRQVYATLAWALGWWPNSATAIHPRLYTLELAAGVLLLLWWAIERTGRGSFARIAAAGLVGGVAVAVLT